MTEIPEHLLKRSRERRAGGSGEASGESSTAPATVASSTPAVAPRASTPEPVATPAKADPPYVAAAKKRGRIPSWAMLTLALMPIFLFMYVRGLQPQKAEASGPILIGQENYGACASCHGADGGGGAGRVFKGGEVLKTFPHIEDMLNWVYVGSEAFRAGGVATYGDPNREGGAHAPYSYNGSPMPAQGAKYGGALTDYEILGVVCHVRYDLAGADPAGDRAEEYAKWCSPDSEIFLNLENGSLTFDSPELHIGTDPRPGTTASEMVGTGG